MKSQPFEEPRQGIIIEGVGINTDAPDFEEVKSLEDLRELGIFDHLDDDKKNKAELKLLEKLGVSVKQPVKIQVGDTPKV